MNPTAALKATATHGGPMVFGAGVAMLAVALVDVGQGVQPPAAIGPRPAATVTVTAPPPAPVAQPSTSASAAVSPSLVAVGRAPDRSARTVPVAAQSGPSPRPTSPVPGGSSSAPGTGSTSPSRCEGAVSARLRLGVLPRCAITIQGR